MIKLTPKNTDNPGFLLDVCRNCTIKYHPVSPEGSITPTWYFLGEAPGQQEDQEGRPFVGDAGKLLRRMITEANMDFNQVRIYNATACRPVDDSGYNRTPESSESVPCFNTFAKTDILKRQPKVIIAVGREAFIALFPEMYRLSMKEMIQVSNLKFEGIPVKAIYHTSYLNRTGGATSPHYAPMVAILKEIVNGTKPPEEERKERRNIVCYPSDLVKYKELFTKEPNVALDFEATIDSAYDAEMKVGLLGLANSEVALAVLLKDPFGEYPIPEDFYSSLKEILDRRVLVFNASYEMPVCVRFYNIDLANKVHDLMQTCRALNITGGLKNICRLHLNAPAWSSTLEKWTGGFFDLAELLHKKRKSQVLVLDKLRDSKSVKEVTEYLSTRVEEINSKLQATPDSNKLRSEITPLAELLQGLLAIHSLINAIPDIDEERRKFYDEFYATLLSQKAYGKRHTLDYNDLPVEVVVPYNWADTSFTFDLDPYLEKKLKANQCEEAAVLYDEHVRLEVELTSAGITWDDLKAEEILSIYNEKSIQTLKDLVLHPLLAEQLQLSDAQKLEILAATKEEKVLKYFNPRSSHITTKTKFNTALITKDLKYALILFVLGTDADLMLKIKEEESLASKYPTLLPFIDEETQIAKCKEFTELAKSGKLGQPTPEEMRIIKKANNFEIDGINQGMFEEMFDLFTKYVGVDANKKETWTTEFKLLYYCRLFKKISKGRSAYIEGKCGRGQVRVCDRAAAQNERLPLRLRKYEDGIPLQPNELYILQPEYKVNDALTKRWKSFIHTIPWGSELRDIHVSRYPLGLLCHYDYSQMEVKILARVSEDEKLISYLGQKGADIHRYIASRVWKKEMKDVTPAERRFAKTSTFAILYGKSEFAFANEIMHGDVEATKQIFESIFNEFPGIKRYIDTKHKEVLDKGEVRTLFGDTIVIPFDPMRASSVSSAKRQAQNYPIQSSASTVAGVSIYRVCKSLQDLGVRARGFGFTHDSGDIDLECGWLIQLLKILPELAEKAPLEMWGVPVSIDIAIGTRGNSMVDLEDIEVAEDLSSFKCEFKAIDDALGSLVKKLEESGLKVSVGAVKEEEEYWDMKELFITRRAYSMFIGESRKKLKGELCVSKL